MTEEAGYGWRFFRDTARSRRRRMLLPVFAALADPTRRAILVRLASGEASNKVRN